MVDCVLELSAKQTFPYVASIDYFVPAMDKIITTLVTCGVYLTCEAPPEEGRNRGKKKQRDQETAIAKSAASPHRATSSMWWAFTLSRSPAPQRTQTAATSHEPRTGLLIRCSVFEPSSLSCDQPDIRVQSTARGLWSLSVPRILKYCESGSFTILIIKLKIKKNKHFCSTEWARGESQLSIATNMFYREQCQKSLTKYMSFQSSKKCKEC